jgi:hypothetical protein
MTRREIVLKKLHNLSDAEVTFALKQLTHFISARLRLKSLIDRTKSGAHGSQNLGMDAVDYYVGESFKRLWEPDGWDWKFENFSLAEQLMRIANKLISDRVISYKSKKDLMPVYVDKDVSDIYDLTQIAEENIKGNEEVYQQLIETAYDLAKDDDVLYYFTIRYLEGADFQTLAEEMNLTRNQIYVLRKKLVRKLSGCKETLIA